MKDFFISLLEVMQSSSREQRQREIAHQLWTAEFKHESYDYILTMVKMGKTDQLLGARSAK